MPKYTRTVLVVTVLSSDADFDQPISDLELPQIAYEITEGNCSGEVECIEEIELTEEEMREALRAQGSDPSFLIHEEGE